MKKISIIFPIYNEEKRLNKLFNSLISFEKKKTNFFFEFILVDDGSTDSTVKKIIQFINKNKKIKYKYKLIKSKKNFGKGHALKLGVNQAKYKWILTMDADLSVELSQITKWLKRYHFKNNHAYFGSRNLPQSVVIYKYYRKLIGYVWQIMFFFFVDSKIKDTQCGFKFYNKNYIKKIFNIMKEYGFAHDVELIFLLRRKGIEIKELPVKWKHVGGSKLNLFFEPINFFFKFWILFIKYKIFSN